MEKAFWVPPGLVKFVLCWWEGIWEGLADPPRQSIQPGFPHPNLVLENGKTNVRIQGMCCIHLQSQEFLQRKGWKAPPPGLAASLHLLQSFTSSGIHFQNKSRHPTLGSCHPQLGPGLFRKGESTFSMDNSLRKRGLGGWGQSWLFSGCKAGTSGMLQESGKADLGGNPPCRVVLAGNVSHG